MRRRSIVSRLLSLSLVLPLGCGVLAATPDKSESHKSTDAGGPGDAAPDVGLPAFCGDVDAGDAYETTAGGTVEGPDVSATLCTTATLYLAPWTDPNFLLELTAPGTSSFESPTGATAGKVGIEISIASAAPGTYRSTDTYACGTAQFMYSTPGGALPHEVSYEAAVGMSNCLGAPQDMAGSWLVTLTSVMQAPGEAGTSVAAHYTVHGTLVATLPGGGDSGDAGSGTVTLSLTF
jgi:hypothetical protein